MAKMVSRCVFALLCCLLFGSVSAAPLQVSVEPGQIEGTVDVGLTNSGVDTISFLIWDTPFEHTLSHNVFLVEKAVKDSPYLQLAIYQGRSVKRAEPSDEHYRIIQPGEKISTTIDIGEYYDIKEFGEHSVRYKGHIHYKVLGNHAGLLQGRTKSALAAFAIPKRADILTNTVAVSLAPRLTPRLKPPIYDTCSIQERADIVEAANIAEVLTNTALGDLLGLARDERAESPRYTEWFGDYTDRRFEQVVTHFSAIDQALENETLQFNCDCNESDTFAYVFPSSPYIITLCPNFRNASPSGTDSRAGTIIHELSHFNVIASTDDHVYGQREARGLARSNPNTAITNADNFEYFAENTPTLAIKDPRSTNAPTALASLQLGVASTASIAAGRVLMFQVANANRIELISSNGDADLYVYTDSEFNNEICRSTNSSLTADVCELFIDGTSYVQVRGYSDANFTLRAESENRSLQDDNVALTFGVPLVGSVAANQQNFYQVNGGNVLELQSLNGDADLYVFSSLNLTIESLVCSANARLAITSLDSCELPISSSPYYVSVVGYTAANYSLLLRSSESANSIRLTPGQAVNGNIGIGDFHYYVASGVSSIELTSITGDANLLVTPDMEFQETGSSCSAQRLSEVSVLDACVVASGVDNYIRISGFTNASYSLLAVAMPPAEDDPNASRGSVRIGGGAVLPLCLLLMFFGFRTVNRG